MISEYNFGLLANVAVFSQIFTLDFVCFLFVVVVQIFITLFIRVLFDKFEKKFFKKKEGK